MDEDLNRLDRESLILEVRRLRDAIREHRDNGAHRDLRWFRARLWALLPEMRKASFSGGDDDVDDDGFPVTRPGVY